MLSESEILSRHMQALSEAKIACDALGLNADPTYVMPRGKHYTMLRTAVEALEGSARQMAHFREDTRWLKLGIFYAKIYRAIQAKYIGQRWSYFKSLIAVFDKGQHSLADLKDRKTGTGKAILPSRAVDWLILPDHKPQLSRQ